MDLPMELWALLATVADDARPLEVRLRALKILERTARDHRREAARELVSVLHAPPDLAGPVHLALLVLDPDLAVGRDNDGRFVASAQPFSGLQDGASPDVGRVVALDELHRLFGPADELPAFLAPPDRPAPAPYRPSPAILEVRRIEAEHAAARALHLEKLRALGLDDDDLDDDLPPVRAPFVSRRGAPEAGTTSEGESVVVQSGGHVVDVGRAHPGTWWADERAGDYRGARRFYLRLDRDGPSGDAIQRRERALPMRDAVVEVALGVHTVTKPITGRGVVVFVEEERGLVTGVTLTWSSWEPFRPVSANRRRE